MGSNDAVIAVAVFGLLIGGVLLLIALAQYQKRKRALKVMNSTMGTVVDAERYVDSSTLPGTSMAGESKIEMDDRIVHYKTDMYRPTVAFLAADGQQYVIKTSFSSNKPKAVGDAIEVVYPPDDPGKAMLKEFYWFWVQLWGIFGAVVFLIGLGALVLGMVL